MQIVAEQHDVDLAKCFVQMMLPLLKTEIQREIKRLNGFDEILTFTEIKERFFKGIADDRTVRNFTARKDFPKIKRNNKYYYSAYQVSEYLKNTK